MHAERDHRVGPRLQRTMRRSSNPRSAMLAALILQSGLGVTVDRLATEFDMDPNSIRALIVNFNVRGTKALSRKKSPDFWPPHMTDEDRSIIHELIRLTPRTFDLPDNRWLVEELLDLAKTHNLLDGIDEQWIRETLTSARGRRPYRAN